MLTGNESASEQAASQAPPTILSLRLEDPGQLLNDETLASGIMKAHEDAVTDVVRDERGALLARQAGAGIFFRRRGDRFVRVL